MQPLREMQPRRMEIDMDAPGARDVKGRATILDKVILLDKGICILDFDKFIWIQMNQNYDKHVERLTNWKDISEEEEWVDKARIIILFFMKWGTLILDIML